MDELLLKLNEYLTAAEAAVVDIAPDVWEATLTIIRFQGLYHLTLGLAFLAVLVWSFRGLLPRIRRTYDGIASHEPRELLYVFFAIWVGFIGMMTGIQLTLVTFLSVFAPELAIMYRLGDKVGIF